MSQQIYVRDFVPVSPDESLDEPLRFASFNRSCRMRLSSTTQDAANAQIASVNGKANGIQSYSNLINTVLST